MSFQSSGSDPILCAHLLRRVDEKLIELLSLLTPRDWDVQTVASRWKVRDVAAHLLDTVLRKLSMARDAGSWKRSRFDRLKMWSRLLIA
jgi:mycothiol maleylpyruvate isomerase-like protein